ncbi:MAG: hypothetical protein L0G99_13090, partial [Propionibacteriales bacterium]|nr:hypothetical protein [Propionibacteriales bacterium]
RPGAPARWFPMKWLVLAGGGICLTIAFLAITKDDYTQGIYYLLLAWFIAWNDAMYRSQGGAQ